jgi:hypothetical protein
MKTLPWLFLLALACSAQPRWWMDEPVRLLQTNLRETDAGLDPARVARQAAELRANALLFGMGGIVAHYPTRAAFHYPGPHLPQGRDLFGEMLAEARRRGIRVIGRFDLSKTQKPVYDAHPEWFVRRAGGEPVIYNGLYSACINGGYYRGQALAILSEALERYDVDGLFFNMFGNPSSDYSGNPLGPCHCQACGARFQARYGRPLPAAADADYRRFMSDSRDEVAASIAHLIRSKRPHAAFLTYIHDHVDGIMAESNTAVDRALPLWPYSASDNVERARTSEPEKMSFNLCMSFVDIPYRFAVVPPAEIQARLFQNMAHGAGPSFTVLGTPDQEDRTALAAAGPVFEWHARHERFYLRQENAARVLLLGAGARQPEYRGWFRLLSERHIPFAVSDNLRALERNAYDLVIAPEGSPAAALDAWVRRGGRAILTGPRRPELASLPAEVRRWTNTRSAYFRLRDRALFPGLPETDIVFLDGEYLELDASGPLTLIPPSIYGPPEKVWTDKRETSAPGLVLAGHGEGSLAYFPWSVGTLYYRHSSPGHAGLMADIVDRLLPDGRQLTTDAHPLVEITVMRQARPARTLAHFVNLSGHSQTAWFAPVEMGEIAVRVKGGFTRARSLALDRPLPVKRDGRHAAFVLPKLGAYDAVVLE